MTYKHIKNAVKKTNSPYITFSELVSKRFKHEKKGFTNLKIHDYDIDGLLSVIGGKSNVGYRRLIMDYVNYGKNHGIFERLVYDGKRWIYMAGQHYTYELNIIRQILRGA